MQLTRIICAECTVDWIIHGSEHIMLAMKMRMKFKLTKKTRTCWICITNHKLLQEFEEGIISKLREFSVDINIYTYQHPKHGIKVKEIINSSFCESAMLPSRARILGYCIPITIDWRATLRNMESKPCTTNHSVILYNAIVKLAQVIFSTVYVNKLSSIKIRIKHLTFSK